MKGTKRFASSDSKRDTNDSTLRSKRIMAGSPFDYNRAEPSSRSTEQQPRLDAQRAESSRQHVRALNSQFASWVQSQLQNHPDELWEDGVQDYLKHASQIMDKFSDVVAWLKANAAKPETVSVFGLHGTESKVAPSVKTNEVKFQLPNSSIVAPSVKTNEVKFQLPNSSMFSQAGSTSNFLWNPIPSKSPSSILFGNQNSAPINREASDDPDGEDELERPSSPSVKKTEEKGIIVVHEVKCKLYIKSIDAADKDVWKDKGMGQLSIKCKEGVTKATKDSKPTIVVRNDVGKVVLNALIYPGIKTNILGKAIAAIFHTSGEASGNDGGTNDTVVARTYLIKTKTEEDSNKLASAIQEYAPAA